MALTRNQWRRAFDKVLEARDKDMRAEGLRAGLKFALGAGVCASISQIKDAIAHVERTGSLPENHGR